MALRPQSSFSSGELDPALRERTNLQKYSSSLATARNVVVGKTGRLMSAPGRTHFNSTKLASRPVRIHIMTHNGCYLEWGHQYVRVYTIAGSLLQDIVHTRTESDLPFIQFTDVDNNQVVVTCVGKTVRTIIVDPAGASSSVGGMPSVSSVTSPSSVTAATWGGTGIVQDYAFTIVKNGLESLALTYGGGIVAFRPILPAEKNDITVRIGLAADATQFEEARMYRRPKDGGAYGYVASSTAFSTSGANRDVSFSDYGQEPDYTHQPPAAVQVNTSSGVLTIAAIESRASCMYQQRLLVSYEGGFYASRPGFPGNFDKEFPLNSSSSLLVRPAGLECEVYYMIDNDGLVLFTSKGVFVHRGALTPTNLTLEKKGIWVISDKVPPLAIPGAVLFVDKLTNTVRQLAFSEEAGTYTGEELSIFSDHLFYDNRITSWAFQDGPVPLLWVVFADGTYATFTYERNEQMRAWTRHDSGWGVELVASSPGSYNYYTELFQDSVTMIVTNRNGTRYVEKIAPRLATVEEIEADPEALMKVIPPMDAVTTYTVLVNDSIVDDNITVTPVTASVWDGPLTISVVNDAIFPSPGAGAVGEVLRHFHPVDGSAVDLEVTARASNNSITVQPSATFPSSYSNNPRLYRCTDALGGLSYMDTEAAAVVADGYVIASPNNDHINYPAVTVASSSVTLPNGYKAAILHVGRPRVMDIETLDIDTVEQRPVLIESKIVNKVYVRTHNSSGLYVGSRFPSGDGVKGNKLNGTAMQALDNIDYDHELDTPVVANRYDAPTSKRHEVTIPGDWKSNGRICIRQVDPLHFEILSIIPDLEDQRR